MITYVDDQVGKLMTALQETGLADNTVVIFTADHGDMMGERGMWFKFNPYEWSVRVPLFVSSPSGVKNHVEERGVGIRNLGGPGQHLGGDARRRRRDRAALGQ